MGKFAKFILLLFILAGIWAILGVYIYFGTNLTGDMSFIDVILKAPTYAWDVIKLWAGA